MPHYRSVKPLPSAEELIREIPLSEAGRERVARDRAEVEAILDGKDSRLLVIVGPCSAWPNTAVLEYARRLKTLSERLNDQLKLVLRVYIQKPRTAKGWTGPVNQPDPFEPADIAKGMSYARRLMVDAIELGLPIADEAVFTHNADGFIELLSWVAIGARSTEDQEHRVFASAIGAPVGMKNPTSGCIPVGVNSVIAAQHPHTAVLDGRQIETDGNPYAHLVLRGGANGPNYSLHDLYRARKHMIEKGVPHPAVLVDCSHDNCRIDGVKNPSTQGDVVREVLGNLKVHPDLMTTVRGFQLESFLKTGAQKLEACTRESVDMDGLSITDPCLGWDETERLLEDMAEQFRDLRGERDIALSS